MHVPEIKNENINRIDAAVIIALGSNLPGEYVSTHALLEAAVARLPDLGLRMFSRSSWWRSAAWPDPSKPDYLNGIVLVETGLEPAPLLAKLMRLERAFGRHRSAANAERTLDLDLIAHGRRILREESLTVPHPRAAERFFVMGPLAEVAPEWTHPILGETARDLALAASVGRDAASVRGQSEPPRAGA